MEDIEDMFKSEAVEDQQQRVVKGKVLRTTKRPVKAPTPQEDEVVEETEQTNEMAPEAVSGELPGKAKVYVKTYGCSHNISDSEYMAGLL